MYILTIVLIFQPRGCGILEFGGEAVQKIFACGLPQDEKEAQLKEHFGQFGEIETVTLKTDMAIDRSWLHRLFLGRSRGFCSIVYKSVDSLEAAVAAEHTISNKKVAVKKAQAKQGKVYIGKLPAEVSDDEIKNHMATFGTIANIEQPFDKVIFLNFLRLQNLFVMHFLLIMIYFSQKGVNINLKELL